MTVGDILRILRKRWSLVLALMIVSGTLAALVSWYWLEEEYEADVTVIVSSQKNKEYDTDLDYNDYNLNVKLVNSYQLLCKTDRVLEQVIEKAGLSLTTGELAGKITVSSKQDTEIICVAVRDPDPETAQSIANVLADVFEREVAEIMRMDNVQIIDYAKLPESPVSPDKGRNTAIGLLLGLMAGIGLALLIDYLDSSVKRTEQVEQIMGVPVLGVVPHLDTAHDRKESP